MNYSAFYKTNSITSNKIYSNDKEDVRNKIVMIVSQRFNRIMVEIHIIDNYTKEEEKFNFYCIDNCINRYKKII